MKRFDCIRLGAIAAVLALGIGAVASAQDASTFVIRNVRIFDGERVIPNGAVVVRDGRIAAVGARVAAPSDAQTIDASGKTIVPGLIDAHVHLGDSYKANGGTGLEEAAVYGVTTALDLLTASREDFAIARKAVKDGLVPNGADMLTSGPAAQTLEAPGEAAAWVAWHKAEGADYIKIRLVNNPPERGGGFSMTPETTRAVIRESRKNGLLSVLHPADEETSRQMVKDGLNGIVHLQSNAVNTPDFGKYLARNGTFQSTNIIGVAPVSYRVGLAEDPYLAPYMPAFMIEGLKNARPPAAASFQNQIANFKLIKSAGVLLLAGTDGFYPYNPVLHAELEILVKEGGATPVEVLKMATSNVAKAYRLQDRGRIAKGLRADLLLLDGDPTTNITDTRKINTVWIAGRKIDREAMKTKLTAVAAPAPRGGGPPPAPAAPVAQPPRQ